MLRFEAEINVKPQSAISTNRHITETSRPPSALGSKSPRQIAAEKQKKFEQKTFGPTKEFMLPAPAMIKQHVR
jgi:hypothetical protein